MNIRKRLKGLVVDSKNYYKYGKKAPKYGELIFLNPDDVVKRISARDIEYKYHSAMVVDSWNNEKELYIAEEEKTKAIYRRYVSNCSWEESGYVDILLDDIKKGLCTDLNNKEQIIRRCEGLDKLFEEIKRDRIIKSRKEINRFNYREIGGIEISISNNGELIKTHGGNHRLILAKIFNMEIIPAVIGLVHEDALDKFVEVREASHVIRNRLSR